LFYFSSKEAAGEGQGNPEDPENVLKTFGKSVPESVLARKAPGSLFRGI